NTDNLLSGQIIHFCRFTATIECSGYN
ncbi:uncharacterized protein METZ01_LOCUS272909, partial [marine metagenome]